MIGVEFQLHTEQVLRHRSIKGLQILPMEPDEIKGLLANWTEEDHDARSWILSRSDLDSLEVADFTNGAEFIGQFKDKVHHIELDGCLTKGTTTPLQLEVRESHYQKFWSAPVGMWHYLDLVRRAIETRQRIRGDVILGDFDDSDDPWVHLSYTILLKQTDVAKAYDEGLKINQQLFEAAKIITSAVDELLAKEGPEAIGLGFASFARTC